MSDEISRKDIDDIGKRNNNKDSYKNIRFNGKRTTTDEYTGKKLYYSSKNKYSTSKTANVDHIVPIDQLKEKYSGSLSKSELKRIANSDYNLAITSERLNKSKGKLSNHEYLVRQFGDGNPENAITTYNMLKLEVQGKIAVKADVVVTKALTKSGNALELDKKNIKKLASGAGTSLGKATSAGTSAALMSLTVSSINNIVLVASGEKEAKNAVVDVAKDTGGSFIVGAGLDLTQQAVIEIIKKGGNKELLSKLGGGLPIAEISATIMIANSVVRFINDDITFEECATEIIMNGVGTIAYTLGMAMGGPAGAIVASYVSAQICKSIIEYRHITKMSVEKLRKVNTLASQALIEMECLRNELKDLMRDEFLIWDNKINIGFEKICLSALSNDIEGITLGLDEVMSVIGENVRFKTLEEFDEFFMDENATFTF